MQYIIGSWYRKDELAKRSCIFHTSSGIASMFSGYLMDAVFHLGGRGGLKGWQWYVQFAPTGLNQLTRQALLDRRNHINSSGHQRLLHLAGRPRNLKSVLSERAGSQASAETDAI